jgi:TPR repeat protein
LCGFRGASAWNRRNQHRPADIYLNYRLIGHGDSRAAEEDHPGAQYELGNLYRRGELVEQDFARAGELFEAAGRQGHLGAVNNLGAMYLFGQGVEADPQRAGAYFRIAAEGGLPRGLTNLAYLFENGLGTERDLLRAAQLYLMASLAGDPEAAERMPTLRAELEEAYPVGSERDRVRQIQEFLDALGLDPGPADGLMGPRTAAAIREFEEQAGLPVTGEATPQLREWLIQVLTTPPQPVAAQPPQPAG